MFGSLRFGLFGFRKFGQNTKTLKLAKVGLAKVGLAKVGHDRKRAVEHMTRYFKGTQHTCLRLEPRKMVQTSLLELIGR